MGYDSRQNESVGSLTSIVPTETSYATTVGCTGGGMNGSVDNCVNSSALDQEGHMPEGVAVANQNPVPCTGREVSNVTVSDLMALLEN